MQFNSIDRKHTALAALNRMYDVIDEETILILSNLLNDNKIDKIFVTSCLRTAGEIGEKVLLNEVKTNKDFSVRVASCHAFSFRIPAYPKYIEVRLERKETSDIIKNLPGKFCNYYGK